MIRKIIFASFFSAFCALGVQAQAVIEFMETTHDFGQVVEGLKATHEFSFKNTGNEPLVLTEVRASCGCTTPSWTREPVMPGETGKITAVYNSQGRPGAFNKSITITSNATKPSSVVFIKGNVVKEAEVKTYTAEELAVSPVANLKKAEINIGKVEKGQSVPFEIELNNTGKSALKTTGFKSTCNCVTIEKTSAPEVAPGKKATIKGIYTPRAAGENVETVSIISNDITQATVNFSLKALVVESLSNKSLLKEGTGKVEF